MIGEDFNIRTGNLGGDAEEGGIEKRRKDKKIENGGGEFMEQMRECDLEILNGGGQGRRVYIYRYKR